MVVDSYWIFRSWQYIVLTYLTSIQSVRSSDYLVQVPIMEGLEIPARTYEKSLYLCT